MKTKRTMMLAVCMMLMLVLLTGCAESNLSGTWKLTDAHGVGEMSGMDAGMLLDMAEAFGGSVLMKFEGKTMTLSAEIFGMEQSQSDTYRTSGNTITLGSGNSLTFDIQGDTLTLTDGNSGLVMTRLK